MELDNKQLGVLILDKEDWLAPELGPGEADRSKWVGNGTGLGDGNYTHFHFDGSCNGNGHGDGSGGDFWIHNLCCGKGRCAGHG